LQQQQQQQQPPPGVAGRQREVIWEGELEWRENIKTDGSGEKPMHTVRKERKKERVYKKDFFFIVIILYILKIAIFADFLVTFLHLFDTF
jgi:hypothetical protein